MNIYHQIICIKILSPWQKLQSVLKNYTNVVSEKKKIKQSIFQDRRIHAYMRMYIRWTASQGILEKWKQQTYTLEKSVLDDSSAYISHTKFCWVDDSSWNFGLSSWLIYWHCSDKPKNSFSTRGLHCWTSESCSKPLLECDQSTGSED